MPRIRRIIIVRFIVLYGFSSLSPAILSYENIIVAIDKIPKARVFDFSDRPDCTRPVLKLGFIVISIQIIKICD